MTVWVDVKYANLLSNQLQKFKIKTANPYVANFRCPLCGDSEKNSYKARGYFYQRDKVIFHCHNCGETKPFGWFLKKMNESLYREYLLENFKNDRSGLRKVPKAKHDFAYKRKDKPPLEKLQVISSLNDDHAAKIYLRNRKLPEEIFTSLYYAEKFNAWTNTIIPDKLPEDNDEGRIVIPLCYANGDMFGFQGRSLTSGKYSLRYISIMIDDDQDKVYGLDKFDPEKKVYVTEGPFDSMFLPNAIAMVGSDLNLDLLDKNNTTVIFDNEPRNREILGKISKTLTNGYAVCFWPENLKYKDINDMILGGMNRETVQKIIDENTYQGLSGQMKLTSWRKV